MIELTATGEWYHVSAENEKSASKWVEGPLRKGLYQGKRNLSLVTFDPAQVAEAGAIAAELVLQRDTSYGSGPVTLTVADVRNASVQTTEYVTRAQCLAMARRSAHHQVTVSGEECVIPLPAYYTLDMWDGRNSYMIYHEQDEARDGYIRFLPGAKLRLYTYQADGWRNPVWIRDVKPGDVISDGSGQHDGIYSHYFDLVEVEHTIERRRRLMDGYDGYIPVLVFGRYSEWSERIRTMQGWVAEMYEDEGRDPPVFTVPVDGCMPDAAIFTQLRGYVSGEGGSVLHSTGTIRAYQHLNSLTDAFNEQTSMTWTAEPPAAGLSTWQEMVYPYGRDPVVVTMYRRDVGGWTFDKSTLSGATTMKVKVTVTEAGEEETKVNVTLYGIWEGTPAEGRAAYATVFDQTPIGRGEAIVGQPVEIQLSDDAVRLLREQNGYGGIGIRYDNPYIVCSRSAELLVNAGTAQEETENQGGEST